MQVREIMSDNPACCTPDTNLGQVAKMMVDRNCGCIPVIDNPEDKHPIGVITDRDIVCRCIAKDKNPSEATASDCMSSQVMTVFVDDTVDDCCRMMQENLIRRVLVVDADGCCCGIVSQADVAQMAPEWETGEVVRDLSRPTNEPSRLAA